MMGVKLAGGLGVAAVVALGAGWGGAPAADRAAAAGEGSAGLVAHEWGTFTTFAGADGSPRKFWSEYAEASKDLPRYVWSWGQVGEDAWEAGPISAGIAVGKRDPRLLAMVRMETPVIYFNTSRPATVDVDVRLEAGRMTEFYPPPSSRKANRSQLGTLAWRGVEIRPGASEGELPKGEGTHYEVARQTDAALLAARCDGKSYSEKFLFYRGVADFEPRVAVRALGEGRFEVENRTGAELPGAVIVEVRGTDVRMAALRSVGPRAEATLGAAAGGLEAPAEFLRQRLEAAGLTALEAGAMVRTWRASWFGEEGTRLMYLLPRAEVDRVLPLRITPTPAETARVFVGRAEVLTPERERMVAAVLARCGAEGEPARAAASAELRAALGRFVQPAVQRVRDTTEDLQVRSGARMIVGE